MADHAIAAGTFSLHERQGRPWADSFTRAAGVSVSDATADIRREMQGWYLSSEDDELTTALTDATVIRHAHVMHLHLPFDRATPLPPAVSAFNADGSPPVPWEQVLDSWWAAYPPGHPDWTPEDATPIASHFVRYTTGAAMGPVLGHASGLIIDGERAMAGIIVVDRPQEGPWIADVWRDPTRPGWGSALVRRAASALSDRTHLGLAVTVSNAPAVRAYTRIGFTITSTSWTLLLP